MTGRITFARARWEAGELGLAAARLVVLVLVPPGAPLLVAVDDSLFSPVRLCRGPCGRRYRPVLLALMAWFGAELITGGGLAGLAEPVFGAAQTLWPLAVVASRRHSATKGTTPNLNRPGMRPAGDPHGPARRARDSRSALSHQGSSPPLQPNRIA